MGTQKIRHVCPQGPAPVCKRVIFSLHRKMRRFLNKRVLGMFHQEGSFDPQSPRTLPEGPRYLYSRQWGFYSMNYDCVKDTLTGALKSSP